MITNNIRCVKVSNESTKYAELVKDSLNDLGLNLSNDDAILMCKAI